MTSTTNDGTEPLSLHALLYVENGEAHVNLRFASDPLSIYLRCGALLDRSLAAFGHRLTIITNEPRLLRDRLQTDAIDLKVIETAFDRDVPETLNFRSAHRKLDVFAAFGRGEMGPRPGLVDLDMAMLNPFPTMVLRDPQLVGYDIWHQVAPAYGTNLVRGDIAAISGLPADGLEHWWGGEFLIGPSESFAQLSEVIERLYPKYLELSPGLHHQGDEMLLTAALYVLEQTGSPIIRDGGTAGAVGRWWSARTLSPIEPLTAFSDRSLLHLPADKDLLSELWDRSDLAGASLYDHLNRRLRSRTLTRRIAGLLHPFLPGPRRYAPRL